MKKDDIEKQSQIYAQKEKTMKRETDEKEKLILKAVQTESKADVALENLENLKNSIKIKAEIDDVYILYSLNIYLLNYRLI